MDATIQNAPDSPPAGEIVVFDEPGNANVVFKIANGAGGFKVIDVEKHAPHTWFKVQFPGGLAGWLQDEYVILQGDGTPFGFGRITEPTSAFELTHGAEMLVTDEGTPTPPPKVEIEPEPDDTVRTLDPLLRTALDLTAAYEGGYSSYQNRDRGIVSYGRFQFTLASGALFGVLSRYAMEATSDTARQLRERYLDRVERRDETLRDDDKLRRLLEAAASDPIMQRVQNAVAREQYWDLVQELSIKPRGVTTALGQALLFDMAINHGAYHNMLTLAEEAFGVPLKSRMPDNGVDERDFIAKVAEIRQERMHRLADRYGYGGLRVRGDFWVSLVQQGDWGLMGDEHGMLHPKFMVAVKGTMW